MFANISKRLFILVTAIEFIVWIVHIHVDSVFIIRRNPNCISLNFTHESHI